MSTKLIFVAVVFKFAIAISLNSVFMYFTIDCKSTHRFLDFCPHSFALCDLFLVFLLVSCTVVKNTCQFNMLLLMSSSMALTQHLALFLS